MFLFSDLDLTRKDWGTLFCKGGRPNVLGMKSFGEVGQLFGHTPFAQFPKMKHHFIKQIDSAGLLSPLPCLLPEEATKSPQAGNNNLQPSVH